MYFALQLLQLGWFLESLSPTQCELDIPGICSAVADRGLYLRSIQSLIWLG